MAGETLECTFKDGMVSAHIRSGPAQSFKCVGYLLAKNEKTFRVFVEGSSGIWHKLTDGRGYAPIQSYYLHIKKIGGDPPKPVPPPPPPEPPKKDPINPSSPPNNKDIMNNLQSNATSAWGDSGEGIYTTNPLNPMRAGNFPTIVGYDKGKPIENYYMDHSFVQENLNIIRENLNLGTGLSGDMVQQNLIEKFDRFKLAKPDIHLGKGFQHVFFTRPDLNIYEVLSENVKKLVPAMESDPIFYYLSKNAPRLLQSLTMDFDKSHNFNPFLSNYAQSFELSDEVIKTSEYGETFTGWKVQYGKNNIESKTANTFSISYTDDRNFHVYKIHKAWIDYISKVYRAQLMSKDKYRRQNILDYACSVYYIVCAEDGETIIFWSKYTGVFPTNTPAASSSYSKGNLLKFPEFSINYVYAWKDDFNPVHLAEFNKNSSSELKYVKTYEKSLLSTGKSMAGAPFVETKLSPTGKYQFKLRFRYK